MDKTTDRNGMTAIAAIILASFFCAGCAWTTDEPFTTNPRDSLGNMITEPDGTRIPPVASGDR